ncbi:hypothetical protein BX600DRAFT_189793 [Xylariales sp. PMI_506]|nr:hypothetical protein BX600DRAFT_189793 [Xylariales sp. PMI_506]
MGFFDSWDGASVISRKSHKSKSSKHHKRSKSRSTSRHRTKSASNLGEMFGLDSHYHKHNSSRGSFFNLGNSSSRSFFGIGRSSSYYKRQPRANFVQRMYKQLKRLLRDLVHYAKRHPMKVFMLVIMPLITGGALTALLARFGLRLPPGIERMMGLAARTASGDGIGLVGEAVRMASGMKGPGSVSIERGHHGNMQWEKRSYDDEGWGSGLMDGIRKMF